MCPDNLGTRPDLERAAVGCVVHIYGAGERDRAVARGCAGPRLAEWRSDRAARPMRFRLCAGPPLVEWRSDQETFACDVQAAPPVSARTLAGCAPLSPPLCRRVQVRQRVRAVALVRLWRSGEATRKRSRAMSKRRPPFRRGRSSVAPLSPRCAGEAACARGWAGSCARCARDALGGRATLG